MASKPDASDPLGLVSKYGAQNKNREFLWDEKTGGYMDPTKVAGIQQTVTINGQVFPAGEIVGRSGMDAWHQFTKDELDNIVKYNTPHPSQKQLTQKALADKQAAVNPAKPAAAGGFNPNAGQAASGNLWDTFVNAGSGAYTGNDKVATQFQDPHVTAAAGGMGASSYSGIYQDNQSAGSAATATKTTSQLLQEFAKSDPSIIKAVQVQLIAAGANTNGLNNVSVNGIADGPTLTAYTTLLRNVELAQAAGHQVTPDQMLSTMANAAKNQKDTTSTSTNKTIYLTNRIQANNAILTAMSDKLGRKPTDSEMAVFKEALNNYESANASTTTTTSSTDHVKDAATGTVGNTKDQTQVTSDKGTGTLNFANDFAAQYVQNQHAPEYQAAKNLDWYNVALSALTSSPGQ